MKPVRSIGAAELFAAIALLLVAASLSGPAGQRLLAGSSQDRPDRELKQVALSDTAGGDPR